MWLLENAGDVFQGRRLWLRPGKRYLFGRTKAEAGQLVVSDKTISRKHLTIEVDRVPGGDGNNRNGRSVVTVEDLHTKIGTIVNGAQIRGQKLVLTQDTNEIKMGHLVHLFRITWHPVVLSFSFTSKELRADPWYTLRGDLEQLDIKYIAEYDIAATTHVVAKKRNTPKGLQALINGKYIVVDGFVQAVVQAATTVATATQAVEAPCLLEQDFDGHWPNALDFLPPRGDEPSERPVATYGPDPRRQDIFEGYTFIFQDQKQYESLLPPVTNGKGKALLANMVVPGRTDVDEFVGYVKGVAGETGLGKFEDGSHGKGVVVVRYLPAKGEHVDWFAHFATAVSLRLDHRLIDQREFLDAILAVEPSMLRRPLEVENDPQATADDRRTTRAQQPQHDRQGPTQEISAADAPPPTQAKAPWRRGGRGLTSRFKGFDADLDSGNDDDGGGAGPFEAVSATDMKTAASQPQDEENMFVSQNRATQESAEEAESGAAESMAGRSWRKRRTPAAEDAQVMEGIAPTAAAVKRRRIEAGIDPVPAREASDEEMAEGDEDGEDADAAVGAKQNTKKKIKTEATEQDILEQARKNREAAERRAAEARAASDGVADGEIDASEIRRLTLVEEMAVRRPSNKSTSSKAAAGTRSRADQATDGSGRWDPKWNGRRNFKKFRKQGDPEGRPAVRVIVGLAPAKTKDYGIGDDYWLEGGGDGGAGGGEREDRRPGAGPGGSTSSKQEPQQSRNGSGTADDGLVVDDDDDGDENNHAMALEEPALRTRLGAKSKVLRGVLGSSEAMASNSSIGGGMSSRIRGSRTAGSGGGVQSRETVLSDVELVSDSDPDGRAVTAAALEEDDAEPDPEGEVEAALEPENELELDLDLTSVSSSEAEADATPPMADLPRTRAGKLAAGRRTATANGEAPSPRATRAARMTRGRVEEKATATTQAVSLDVLTTTQNSTAQRTQASSSRGKRTVAGPVVSMTREPVAKRPRRGVGGTSGSTSGATVIRDSDSDDDDGLKFKFRSRR